MGVDNKKFRGRFYNHNAFFNTPKSEERRYMYALPDFGEDSNPASAFLGVLMH